MSRDMKERAAYKATWASENPEKCKAARKRWREKNPHKIKEYNDRQRAKQDPVKKAAYMAKWYADNPDKVDAYAEARRQEHREKTNALSAYKREHGCRECGIDNPIVLVFHHRDPAQKEFTIGNRVSRMSLERLFEEVAKCDILCSNCHLTHHYHHGRRKQGS